MRHDDDEQGLAENLPLDAELDGEGLTLLERFFRTMDDERFRRMKPGQQLLYLQLLRWRYARPQEQLEASRSQMSAWTGLAWDTVKKYLPGLIADGLVTLTRPPDRINPAAYDVHWLPPLPVPAPSPEAAATYVDQLDPEDLAEFHRLECLLPLSERREMQLDIGQDLHQLGIPWSHALIKKLVIWRFLTQSPYRRKLESKHPAWFGHVQPS